MITSDEELSLAYLLDPTFELVNSNGKPLTNGYIEVYVHGTRTKYYCASDFNGTLHPFKIPLDSLGANVVLASPAHTYDVYVYNAFGNLVISRYNVTTVGFTTVINHETVVTSEDNTVEVNTSEASGKTYFDLSIADTVDSLNNELTQKIETASADLLDKIDQTKEELNQKIETASADLLDAIDRNKTEIMQNVESATAVLQYEIETVSSRQVQSDWAETDDELPSYIKNKPEEQELIGGDNIELVETATAVKINCTLDTTPFATHTEVDAKVNTASSTLNNKIDQTKTEINSTINSVSSTINTRIDNVSSAFDAKLAEKKDKQSPYSATGSQTKTLTQIIQNEQGVVSAVFSDIDLPPQVPSVDIISPRNTILVSATTNPETNTKTFSLDVDDNHPQSNVQASTGWCNRVESSENRVYATIYGDEYYVDADNGKLYYKAGYHHVDQLVHIRYSGEPVNRLQRFRIMSTYDRETDHYFDMSYPHEDLITISSVDYNAYAVPYFYSVLYYGAGTATAWPTGFEYKVDIDMHSLKAPLAKSESGQATYQAGRGIDPDALAVDVIQVDSSIPDQATVNATVATASSTLNTRINEVENEIPDVSNLATKSEVASEIQSATAMIPDVSNLATKNEVMSQVQAATAMIPDVSDFATEAEVMTQVQAATAMIPDVSNLATKNEVMSQVQAATALIPDVSDFVTTTDFNTAINSVESEIDEVSSTLTPIAEAINVNNFKVNATGQAYKLSTETVAEEISQTVYYSSYDIWDPVEEEITFVQLADISQFDLNKQYTVKFATDTAMQIKIYTSSGGFVTALSVTATAKYADFIFTFNLNDIINQTDDRFNYDGQVSSISTVEAIEILRGNTHVTTIYYNQESTITIQSPYALQSEVMSQIQAATALIPDVSDLATKTEVQTVQNEVDALETIVSEISAVTGSFNQVQADWTQTQATAVDFIKNKPTEKNLVAGTGITITETNDEVTVQSTEIASGVQLVAGNGINIDVQGTSAIVTAKIELVAALPADPDANTLYLIPEA